MGSGYFEKNLSSALRALYQFQAPLFFHTSIYSATIAKFSRRVHIQGADIRTSGRVIKKVNEKQPAAQRAGHQNQGNHFFLFSRAYRSVRSRNNQRSFLHFFSPIFVTVPFRFDRMIAIFPEPIF